MHDFDSKWPPDHNSFTYYLYIRLMTSLINIFFYLQNTNGHTTIRHEQMVSVEAAPPGLGQPKNELVMSSSKASEGYIPQHR